MTGGNRNVPDPSAVAARPDTQAARGQEGCGRSLFPIPCRPPFPPPVRPHARPAHGRLRFADPATASAVSRASSST